MRIHVSNLSVYVFAGDLKKLFTAYGNVLLAVVYRNETNSRSLGFAMVDMPNDAQAAQAILCLNDVVIDGRKMMLREARGEVVDRNRRN